MASAPLSCKGSLSYLQEFRSVTLVHVPGDDLSSRDCRLERRRPAEVLYKGEARNRLKRNLVKDLFRNRPSREQDATIRDCSHSPNTSVGICRKARSGRVEKLLPWA